VKDELAQAFGVYLDNAAAPLLAAVEKNPKDTAALLDLGLFYADNERWTDSADAFDRLLAVDPENAAAINNRANLYLLSGEIAKARALYMKAAQADPQDEGVQLNLVRAAKRAGDKTSAQAAFRRALEIAPALKSTYARWEEVGE
jgi:Flp pilus assembly protein TadD